MKTTFKFIVLLSLFVGYVNNSLSQNPDTGESADELARRTRGDANRYSFESVHMGTQFRIVLYSESEKKAREASKLAFERVAQLEQIFSDYKSDSELGKLCKANDKEPGQFRAVSKEMLHVLKKAKALSEKSEGVFDVTIGPLSQLWRVSKRTQELPNPQELTDAKSRVGFEKIELDENNQKIKLAVKGMRLDFGGIVKGYSADEALEVLKKQGFTQALVAASGDIRVGDAPPGKSGWLVEIEPLGKNQAKQSLQLKNQAVSTSGDLFQYVEIKGVRYSHILDPKTGLGLTGRRSVTVISQLGIDADSLTKACMMLPNDKSMKLIDSMPGSATFIAVKEADDSPIKASKSKQFDTFVEKK